MTTNQRHANDPDKNIDELAQRLDVYAHDSIQGGCDPILAAGAFAIAARVLREQNTTIGKLRWEVARQLSGGADPYADADGDAEDAAPADAPTAAGGARCRHEWGAAGVCTKCGKPKGKQGRKPAAAAAPVSVGAVDGVTKVDPPSHPLPHVVLAPRPLGAAVADRMKDGPV